MSVVHLCMLPTTMQRSENHKDVVKQINYFGQNLFVQQHQYVTNGTCCTISRRTFIDTNK